MKLLRYIQGLRKGREANRLEKEAMQDPFLADAMQGYDSVEGDHIGSIESLQKRISARSTRKRIRYKAWSIAASIILVAGISTYFLLQNVSVNQDLYTVSQKLPEERRTSMEATPASKAQIEEETPEAEPMEDFIVGKNLDTLSVIIPIPPLTIVSEESDIAMADESIIQEESVITQIDDSVLAGEAIAANRPSSRSQNSSVQAVAAMAPASSNKMVRGKVTDQNGEPIAGANVIAQGTKYGALSDVDGNFELISNDSIDKLMVSYIGYEPVIIPADTGQLLAITLHEDNTALNEVVVIVNDTERKSVVPPEPVIGFNKFKKYIKKNKISPTDAECVNIKGEVVVEFYIDTKGRPYNLSIKKSLCNSADKEAMRLIMEGPDWTKGENKVEVTVKF